MFRLPSKSPSSDEPGEVDVTTVPETSEVNTDDIVEEPPQDPTEDEPHMTVPNASGGAIQVCQLVDEANTCQGSPGHSASTENVTISENQVPVPGTSGIRTNRRISLSIRAGITFPIRRIFRKLKKRTQLRIWIKAAVYTAAVLQYVVSEVLDLAGTITKRLKKKIIKPKHINNALRCDEELDKLTRKSILPEVTKMLLMKKP